MSRQAYPCAACGLLRDEADLLAFWSLGQQDRLRYVCRPTCQRSTPNGADVSCFRIVGSAARFGIALAGMPA